MKENTVAQKVRTTNRPDVEIDVDDAELHSLRVQGLLYTGQATTDDGARRSVEHQQADSSAGTEN